MNTPLIVPIDGLLSAHIFENEHIGLPRTLFYTIEISVVPTKYDGQEESSDISLNFIRFPGLQGHKNLPGKTYAFPLNPNDGYIDGSLYYGNAHNPCDITEIHFGEISGDAIRARIVGSIDFTFEGPEELGIHDVDCEVWLKLHFDSIVAAERIVN